MERLTRIALVGATMLYAMDGAPAWAANAPVSGLGARGAVAGADQIPDLPNGATSLQAAYASDIKKYALNSIDIYGADPTGVTDSTSAIQMALNSGQSLTCNGVYKVSATLTMSTTASHGQVIAGSGATNSGGGITAGRCIFKPVAGMAGAVFKIDGTPFGGWLQGFGFENLTIDLVNMTDVATNVAFNQVQAYDGHYDHIRIVNDGSNKRAWLFSTGAYTTTLRDTQGNILDCEGTSTSNGATTITVLSHDGGSVVSNYCNSLRFLGGAYQGSNNTKFYFRFGTDYEIATDVEGTGVFLNVDNTVNYLFSHTELQGFSGTYMVGTPGQSTILLDQQVNYNTYPFGLTVGGVKFNNQGAAGVSSFYSGATGVDYQVILGRVANDVLFGVAASASDILPGTAAGDGVLTTLPGSSSLFLGGGDVPGAKITASGLYTYGTGTMQTGIVNVTPPSDTDALTVQNHAGSYLFDVNTSSGFTSSLNGQGLIGYSGSFTGQTWKITTSNGVSLFQEDIAQPAVDGVALQVNNAAATKNVFSVSTAPASAGMYLNATLLNASSPPTYSSGFSTGAPTVVGTTSAAFTVAIGATPGATGVLTMPTASTGWNCMAIDRTTAAGIVRETGSTTASVTFALTSTAVSDVLQFQCTGY